MTKRYFVKVGTGLELIQHPYDFILETFRSLHRTQLARPVPLGRFYSIDTPATLKIEDYRVSKTWDDEKLNEVVEYDEKYLEMLESGDVLLTLNKEELECYRRSYVAAFGTGTTPVIAEFVVYEVDDDAESKDPVFVGYSGNHTYPVNDKLESLKLTFSLEVD